MCLETYARLSDAYFTQRRTSYWTAAMCNSIKSPVGGRPPMGTTSLKTMQSGTRLAAALDHRLVSRQRERPKQIEMGSMGRWI